MCNKRLLTYLLKRVDKDSSDHSSCRLFQQPTTYWMMNTHRTAVRLLFAEVLY